MPLKGVKTSSHREGETRFDGIDDIDLSQPAEPDGIGATSLLVAHARC
jgi:hypothetical protein